MDWERKRSEGAIQSLDIQGNSLWVSIMAKEASILKDILLVEHLKKTKKKVKEQKMIISKKCYIPGIGKPISNLAMVNIPIKKLDIATGANGSRICRMALEKNKLHGSRLIR